MKDAEIERLTNDTEGERLFIRGLLEKKVGSPITAEQVDAAYRLYKHLDKLAQSGVSPRVLSFGLWYAQRLVWYKSTPSNVPLRPPINAEYLLYLFLRRNERDEVIGDLIETYGHVLRRFGKARADLWFYRQVVGSIAPLVRRCFVRIGALIWLGRILRRLTS